MKTLLKTGLIFMAMVGSTYAFQGDEPGRPDEIVLAMADERPAGGPPSDEKREEIGKKINAVRIYRMTEELKLDEKTTAKFIPVVSSLDQSRMALMKERMEILRDTRSALDSKTPDEKTFKQLLERMEKMRRDLDDLENKELKAVKENLTLEQQLRYFVFKDEFQKEVRQIINQARRGGPEGRGKPLPPRENID